MMTKYSSSDPATELCALRAQLVMLDPASPEYQDAITQIQRLEGQLSTATLDSN